MSDADFLHEEPPAYGGVGKTDCLQKRNMQPLKLDWDSLTIQSREEFCQGACVFTKLSAKKWRELEPWLQYLLADSIHRRSKGRLRLGD